MGKIEIKSVHSLWKQRDKQKAKANKFWRLAGKARKQSTIQKYVDQAVVYEKKSAITDAKATAKHKSYKTQLRSKLYG